ncbi:MAG: iron-sulfur cluster repair di-iron protein [Thermoleophilia bacterium]
MDITSDTRVGDIATTVPASISVFERYGVDFCCGGDSPLSEALHGTGLSVGDILAEIESAAASIQAEDRLHEDWAQSDPAALADHIEAVHHSYLRERLPSVGRKMATVLMVHSESHPELFELGRLFEQLRTEIEQHLRTEEEVVFPAVRALAREAPTGSAEAGLKDWLRGLETEHDAVGALLKAMRGITSTYQTPFGACATYSALFQDLQALEADIHRHVHLENNVMFATTRRLLAE